VLFGSLKLIGLKKILSNLSIKIDLTHHMYCMLNATALASCQVELRHLMKQTGSWVGPVLSVYMTYHDVESLQDLLGRTRNVLRRTVFTDP
jgi:hypothetical protein